MEYHFVPWLNQNAGAIQALTSLLLVFVTTYSIVVTVKSLRVSRKAEMTAREAQETSRQALDENRRQFALEWKPYLLVSAAMRDNAMRVSFINGGKAPLVLQKLIAASYHDLKRADSITLNTCLVVGQEVHFDLAAMLTGLMPNGAEKGAVAIECEFFSLGQRHTTDRFVYTVIVRNSVVSSVRFEHREQQAK